MRGARWFKPDNNVSGKRCPICGREGVEVQRRYYRCPKCNVTYGRDWTAAFNAAKLLLRACKAERQLEALSQWLQSHKTALTPAGPGPSSPGSPSRGGPRAPRAARGGDVPAATRAEGRPA
ncbi:MAG: hypothetical protein B7L53_05910, partial [Thermofilum sp. NZ13]